jgi:hypothetical protein
MDETLSELNGPMGADELDALLHALCDGMLDGAGYARLNELLNESDAACQRYIEFMDLQVSLVHCCVGLDRGTDRKSPRPSLAGLPGAASSKGDLPADDRTADGTPITFPRLGANDPLNAGPGATGSTALASTGKSLWRALLGSPWGLSGLAAAALVLVSFGLWYGRAYLEGRRLDESIAKHGAREKSTVDPGGGEAAQSIAQVVRLSPDATWEDGNAAFRVSQRIMPSDTIRLAAGLAQIKFVSGAKIILHGPAVFTATGPTSGQLESGRLTGDAANVSFHLTTLAAEIIDLGSGVATTGQVSTPTNWLLCDAGLHPALCGDVAAYHRTITNHDGGAVWRMQAAQAGGMLLCGLAGPAAGSSFAKHATSLHESVAAAGTIGRACELALASEILDRPADDGDVRGAVWTRQWESAVDTASREAVSPGTEFGLDVCTDRRTEVVVFRGAVGLRLAKRDRLNKQARVQRLAQGDGVVIDERGQIDRIMSIVTGDAAAFRRDSEPRTGAFVPVIVQVSDNLRASDTKKFYEIVPGGMREDALAYVDRPEHDWNGVDTRGMPAYLIGADYIKPFNADKRRRDVEITVTLGRPSRLFIFFDDRIPVPDWLREGFHDTGDDIALDVGPVDFGPGKVPIVVKRGFGPGNLVDDRMSVWERIVDKPGPNKLGLNGGITQSSTMYGIAAIPLKSEELKSDK